MIKYKLSLMLVICFFKVITLAQVRNLDFKRTENAIIKDLEISKIPKKELFNGNTLKNGYQWLKYAPDKEYEKEILVLKEIENTKEYYKELKKIISVEDYINLLKKYPIFQKGIIDQFNNNFDDLASFLRSDRSVVYFDHNSNGLFTVSEKNIYKSEINKSPNIEKNHKILPKKSINK